MSANGKPKNPCGKVVEPEEAYEVYQTFDGTMTYFVLRKYQSPENEAKNPYAKWLCNVRSPWISARGDTGDVYVSSVKSGTHKLSINPITGKPIGKANGG